MRKKIGAIQCSILMIISSGVFISCGDDYPVEKGATELLFYARDFEDWSNTHLFELVKQFNSNMDDGIQVTMSMYEDSEYIQAIKSARESNRAPDLYMVSYGNIAQDVKNGYPAKLNDLLPQSAFDDLKDYAKDMVTYDGNYYAYPQLTEPSSLLFYRNDMLETANVTKDPKDWSFADMVDACAKIKPTLQSNQYVLGMPTGLPLSWSTVGIQHNTAGYYPINDNWDTSLINPTITTPTENYASENGYANVARYWWDLYSKGYVPAGLVSSTGYTDIIEGICWDRLAMTIGGSWSIAQVINEYPEYVDLIGVAPIPTIDGDKSGATATNGGWTYAISDSISADRKAKAASFISWLLINDVARTSSYFETAHYSKAPVNKSVETYLNEFGDDSYSDWRAVINDVASKALPEPIYNFDVTTKFGEVLSFITINADNRPSADIDSILSEKLLKARDEINNVISLNHMAGTNPKRIGA